MKRQEQHSSIMRKGVAWGIRPSHPAALLLHTRQHCPGSSPQPKELDAPVQQMLNMLLQRINTLRGEKKG